MKPVGELKASNRQTLDRIVLILVLKTELKIKTKS